MSADNTIMILHLKDQWRVKHLQASENLWWSFLIFGFAEHPVFTRIIEYFDDAKTFPDALEAMEYAHKLYEDYSYVEYGLTTLEIPHTWSEIFSGAVYLAKAEIIAIENRQDYKKWENETDFLWKLVKGKEL